MQMLVKQHNYPVKAVCQVWDAARSSYYYQRAEPDEGELRMRSAVEQVAAEWPTYGCRRVSHQLRRQGYHVNTKHVWRVMRELGLQAAQPKKKCRTTNSAHSFPRFPNLVLRSELDGSGGYRWSHLDVVRPEQLWVGDITYVRLGQGFVYLAVLMDVFTRQIRGWQLGRSLDGELSLTALRRALTRGTPEIHHSDQGVQYAATGYVELLRERGVAISMAEVGQAWQNGYAERLMRTIKEEEVALTEYQDFHDAYSQIERFLEEVYQHKRIHSALGYLTPAEFEQSWREGRAVQPGELPVLLP
jgi:transposase InsO family protein